MQRQQIKIQNYLSNYSTITGSKIEEAQSFHRSQKLLHGTSSAIPFFSNSDRIVCNNNNNYILCNYFLHLCEL